MAVSSVSLNFAHLINEDEIFSTTHAENVVVEAFKKYISEKFDVKKYTEGDKQDTLLHLAVRNGRIRIIKALTLLGADWKAQNLDRETPLGIVTLFIPEGRKIAPFIMENDQTDLWKQAVAEGHEEELETLISDNNEAWRFWRGVYGETLAHVAAALGSSKTLALLKESAHLSLFELDNQGNTPLYYAVEAVNQETSRVLVNRGALQDSLRRISVMNHYTRPTPFHVTCENGATETLLILLNTYFRQLNFMPLPNGNNPLHIAAFYGHAGVLSVLLNLRGASAFLSVQNRHQCTPLDLAVLGGSLGAVHIICKRSGIYVGREDRDKAKRLSEAAKHSHITHYFQRLNKPIAYEEVKSKRDYLRGFVRSGFDPNAPDENGETAVEKALSEKDDKMALKLIYVAGAEVTAKTVQLAAYYNSGITASITRIYEILNRHK